MSITEADFTRFFAAVNDGHRPFPWQERLLRTILSVGHWPTSITAPTGSGKSAVVDIHIFLTALSAVGNAPRLPRRLCVVVGRRALVDSQADRAQRILDWLVSRDDQLAQEMGDALLGLCSTQSSPPVVLANLRGGLASDKRWIDDPSACSVICATPDMWGSRLLFRGYGTSRAARPREAGLLGIDSVVVIDEAHLSRQLLGTARWVSAQNTKPASALGLPGLQVVESSATARPGPATERIGIDASDLADPELAPRMTRPKPIEVISSSCWSDTKATKAYIAEIIAELKGLRDQTPGGTIGCVVNRIDTALRIADSLGEDCPCWVGPMRPADLHKIKGLLGLLRTPSANATAQAPPFLIATQTVEVGVDIDLAGLVTELASAESMAQRFGRVNRRGLRTTARIKVIAPSESKMSESKIADQAPYGADDLRAGLNWLRGFDGPQGACPARIMDSPPPSMTPERQIVKLPHRGDVMRWEATDDDMLAEEKLELWIRDSLEPERLQAGLVVRDELPELEDEVLPLLEATPPTDEEIYPAELQTVRKITKKIIEGQGVHARAFIRHDGSIRPALLEDNGDLSLVPGDVVIIDNDHPVTRRGVVVADATGCERRQTFWGGSGVRIILPGSRGSKWLTELCGLSGEDAQRTFTEAGEQGIVTLGPDLTEGITLPWIVVAPAASVEDDESMRQEWTAADHPVGLDAHLRGVAARAESLAQLIGLPSNIRLDLSAAGLHHDDGKADPRFQRFRLGNTTDQVLAKSLDSSTQSISRRRWSGGLPRGWRHELRSVAVAWPTISREQDAELIARLIGTSHGHGRVLPQANAHLLCDEGDSAEFRRLVEELFVEGEWCEIMTRTSWCYGSWACAYLEAVLRAADCQVSREGS